MDDINKEKHISSSKTEVESANEAYERAMAELEALTSRSLHTSDTTYHAPAEKAPAEAYHVPAPTADTAAEPTPPEETPYDAIAPDEISQEESLLSVTTSEADLPDTAGSEPASEAVPPAPDDATENSVDDHSEAVSVEETAGTDKTETGVENVSSETEADSPESSVQETAADEDNSDKDPDPDTTSSTDNKKNVKKKKKSKKKSRGISKGFIYLIVLFECMILIIALVVFSHSVSINRNDKLAYHDPAQVDEISCYDGKLNVNNVTVTVPVEKNITYKKSYTWSPDDKDYPTIPHAVTAGYYNDEGTPLYDISLYRESFTKTADIPRGKDAANWFKDWKKVSDENSTQESKDIEDIHGFLISSKNEIEEGDTGTTYASTTYYFTSQDENGLSVYILEGILYDAESLDAYNVVMHNAMTSLTINQQAA